MRYRTLGRNTGLLVSEMALGVSLFGRQGYGATPEDAKEIFEVYLQAGGNFVDTASRYRSGGSEEMLGQLMAPHRDALVVATKYGLGVGTDPALGTVGANRKAMVQSVEGSLRRLDTDRIDLLHIHMDDLLTPIEEVQRGLDDLISAGKVVYGGFSNYPAWRLAYGVAKAEQYGWAPITATQIEYSLIQRTPEREILPMADACGIGVVGFSPLAGGLLTGKYRQGGTGRADGYATAMLHQDVGREARIISEVLAVAAESGATASQVALAWMRRTQVIPLIGPRTPAQLSDNLGALALHLDDAHLERIDEASAVPMGYPHELVTADEQRASSTGGRQALVDLPGRPVL